MAEFHAAFQAAAETNHQPPSWANEHRPAPPNLPQITQRAIDIYMLSQQPNGEMGGIGWWQTANGYTAIALHDIYSRSNHNYQRTAEAVKKCEGHRKGLVNEFNDDTLWWAMCCLDLYTLGRDPWFLDKARGIWEYMQRRNCLCGRGQVRFGDQDMEGACYWTTREGEGQINSISSGLYAELSARLATIERSHGGDGGGGNQGHSMEEKHPHMSKLMHLAGVGGEAGRSHGGSYEQYIEAARCSLGWVLRCLYRPRDGVVLDGILLKKGEKRDWAFTYLTGKALGACAALYEATDKEDYLTLAIHMAHKAMRNPSWVEDDGILTEHETYGEGNHDPAKNDDAVTFKQVLMRHLGTLYEVMIRKGPRSEKVLREAQLIKTFVNVNFAALQERNTNGNGQYGPWVKGPFCCPTSHSQLAVLDTMAAVMLVNRQ